MEIKLFFSAAEQDDLHVLAREAGVSVEKLAMTLIREAYAQRLRTSSRIGASAQLIEFRGPENGLNDQE